jgi:hypothetical protein
MFFPNYIDIIFLISIDAHMELMDGVKEMLRKVVDELIGYILFKLAVLEIFITDAQPVGEEEEEEIEQFDGWINQVLLH